MLASLSMPKSALALFHGVTLCSLLLGTAHATPMAAMIEERAAPPTKYPVISYAPLGDSFSTGPGDGGKLVTFDYGNCSIFDTSFPFRVFNDNRLRYDSNQTRGFYPAMCAGATAQTIPAQVLTIGNETNMASITIGSNDVGLAGVLNDCVFGFYPSGRSCSAAVTSAQVVISSSTFTKSLESAFNSIFTQAPASNVYVMGYPTFFNENTPQCNTACFRPLHTCGKTFLMTHAQRAKVNSVVKNLNSVVKSVVLQLQDRSNGSIQFVPNDDNFDGHRFCEAGVTEPDYNNAKSWFFPFTYFPRPWLNQYHHGNCTNYDILQNGEIGDMFACAVYLRQNEKKLNGDKMFQSTAYPDPGTNSGVAHAPDFFNRIFHLNLKGASKVHDALVKRYVMGN